MQRDANCLYNHKIYVRRKRRNVLRRSYEAAVFDSVRSLAMHSAKKLNSPMIYARWQSGDGAKLIRKLLNASPPPVPRSTIFRHKNFSNWQRAWKLKSNFSHPSIDLSAGRGVSRLFLAVCNILSQFGWGLSCI